MSGSAKRGDQKFSVRSMAATLAATPPGPASSTRNATEEWITSLGVELCDVWFFKAGSWVLERQVEDHDTFLETIGMTFSRMGASYALWHDGQKWCLLSKETGDCRRYPNREAAEMVAVHNG